MAALIGRLGGKVQFGADVDRILVSDGRARGVRLADGSEIAADIVVSNADVGHTYRHLLRDVPRRRWRDARLGRLHWSMSLFVWHFGTRDTRGDWPDVGHHTILMGPRYRGLIKDIFGGRLAEDMSLYLHRPAVTDPSAAPPGGDAFYVLAPVPHLGSGIDWSAERIERFRRAIAARLDAVALPGFAERIEVSEVMTPVDFRDRYLSPFGAGFSIEPRLTQSAYFRPHNRSEDVDGLYIVGAGTHPGAGLPGVLTSAAILDEVVENAPAA
jgi:phytoene desaturase